MGKAVIVGDLIHSIDSANSYRRKMCVMRCGLTIPDLLCLSEFSIRMVLNSRVCYQCADRSTGIYRPIALTVIMDASGCGVPISELVDPIACTYDMLHMRWEEPRNIEIRTSDIHYMDSVVRVRYREPGEVDWRTARIVSLNVCAISIVYGYHTSQGHQVEVVWA